MVGRLSVFVRIFRISLLFPPLAGLNEWELHKSQNVSRWTNWNLFRISHVLRATACLVDRWGLQQYHSMWKERRGRSIWHLELAGHHQIFQDDENLPRWGWSGRVSTVFHPWVGYKLIIGTLFWKRIATAPRALGIHPKSQANGFQGIHLGGVWN